MFGLQRILSRITGAGTLTFGGAITTDKTQTFQDKTGTIALTSDFAGGYQPFRNLLHNGRVEIDQRATLATPAPITTGTPTYGPDGFVGVKVSGSVVATIGKVAVVNTPMTGSLSACKLNVTTAASTAAGDQIAIRRVVEGNIFSRASFGSAQAAALYLSFWIESSTSGTVHISLRNAANNRSYVTTYNVASANTRTLCQATIPGDTGGTWVTDANASATLDISGAVGSTYWGTAGAWSASDTRGTSASGILGNAVHSISISDVYLGTEPISGVTTDYPHVPYDVELLRCKRYLQRWDASASSSTAFMIGEVTGTTAGNATMQLNPEMRDAPTLSTSAIAGFSQSNANGTTALSALTLGSRSSRQNAFLNSTCAAGGFAAGQAGRLQANVTTAVLTLSAEL
jgi:hypothetical protein